MTDGPVLAKVGPFTLKHRLKLGGTAEVFAAMGQDGVLVALKRMLPNALEEEDGPLMFQAEARIMGRLEHPRIARLLADGASLSQMGEVPVLVYELVDGVDLATLRRRLVSSGRVPDPTAVAAIGWQAADALAYVHANAVVHRDISPHNLMLDHSGCLKIIDFGIAKYPDNPCETGVGIIKGKHAYMSPEQVDEGGVEGRSDVFSLGVTLYELATTTRLFRANTPLETLQRIRESVVPPLLERAPKVPHALAAIIESCLRRDVGSRPTAQVLTERLGAWVAARGVEPEKACRELLVTAYDGQPPSAAKAARDALDYRAGLRSAEMDGEETTDQLEHSNATRIGSR